MSIYAEFVMSAASPSQFLRDGLPEIALVGRSNVGKSSMVNGLVQSKKLARTSNTPGRTQTLNFYRVWPEGKPRLAAAQAVEGADRFSLQGEAQEAAQKSGAFYFVDMPGYGFAKVSETQRKSWRRLIEGYLLERENLRAVIQVVDLRHPPTRDDIAMWDWLRHHDKVRLCLATKADKIGKNQQVAHLKEMAAGLEMSGRLAPGQAAAGDPSQEPILSFSAETGAGREELWQWVLAQVLSDSTSF